MHIQIKIQRVTFRATQKCRPWISKEMKLDIVISVTSGITLYSVKVRLKLQETKKEKMCKAPIPSWLAYKST